METSIAQQSPIRCWQAHLRNVRQPVHHASAVLCSRRAGWPPHPLPPAPPPRPSRIGSPLSLARKLAAAFAAAYATACTSRIGGSPVPCRLVGCRIRCRLRPSPAHHASAVRCRLLADWLPRTPPPPRLPLPPPPARRLPPPISTPAAWSRGWRPAMRR